MAIMYPKDLVAYSPNDSEREVYNQLRDQLPDSFEVFYSFKWSYIKDGKMLKSEADFIIVSPDYGYLCIEVKGGSDMTIDIDSGVWHLCDSYGGRDLDESPYDQAEHSMYFLRDTFKSMNSVAYPGIYGAGVIFPFYSIPDSPYISDRNAELTIDKTQMNDLYNRIIHMYDVWGSSSYKARAFKKSFHDAFVEMIKKKIAIAAAAGSLIELKRKELEVVNRVQDNYIFFLNNIRQFYVRGGAGTGKTWLAIKMANSEAKKDGADVLCACASKPLSEMIKSNVSENVEVKSVEELFSEICEDGFELKFPTFDGIEDHVKEGSKKYDAIFIDEAQDFTPEWAYVIRLLLKDEHNSRLGVFYDDVQILREESFADAFMIDTPPFLLRENIRNTSSIYDWATERTNLGKDVISNPVEGPKPTVEKIKDYKLLTNRLQNLFKEYLVDEGVKNSSITILLDNLEEFMERYKEGIARWKFVTKRTEDENEIFVSEVGNYKGLESDMVIYIHHKEVSANIDYIAFTRAKYYLIELIIN